MYFLIGTVFALWLEFDQLSLLVVEVAAGAGVASRRLGRPLGLATSPDCDGDVDPAALLPPRKSVTYHPEPLAESPRRSAVCEKLGAAGTRGTPQGSIRDFLQYVLGKSAGLAFIGVDRHGEIGKGQVAKPDYKLALALRIAGADPSHREWLRSSPVLLQFVVPRMAIGDGLGPTDQHHTHSTGQQPGQLPRKSLASRGCQKQQPGQDTQHDRKDGTLVVARDQYKPATSGTNAPTSVTW